MKYVSGRVKELKVGISSYSEDKTPFSVVGNVDVIGIISATTVSISTTTDVASEFTNINVSGISTFNGEIDSNGRIVGAATSNVIPFLYSNYSDLPSAGTYHGAFAHVHATQRAYFAHGGAWYQLINQEPNGTVGTGTERYNIGPVDLTSLDVSGIATFTNVIDSNGRIVGAATSNVIPFLYSNFSDLPSAVTYHGAFAHVHGTGKAYYAHAANWYELVNKELNGTVGTGTEKYNVGVASVANLRVAGISTYDGNLDVQSSVLITGITTIGGLVDINAGAQANTLKVEDLTDNRVVIAGTGGELEDDANLTFNGTTFNVGSAITMYQATGIVSATSFFGDGSGLENTGSTLSQPSSGTQRLVTTSLTTGTMTSSGIGSELAFDYSNNHLEFTDNTKATFGTGNDLQLYHNATASYIDNNTGALYIRNNVDDDDGGNIIIQAKSGKTSAVFQDDEGVRLYYDDVEKVATTGYGVTVNGTTETQKLYVTGISTFTGLAKFNGNFEASGNVTLGSDANDRVTVNAKFDSDLHPSASTTYDLGNGTGYWKTLWVKNIYTNASGISTFKGAIDADGHTELNTLQVAGISTFDGTVNVATGNSRLNIGDANGQIYRSNNDFYIDVAGENNFYVTTNSAGGNAGAIYLRPKGSEQGVTVLANGSVELYYDNSKKLDTIGAGVTVTGDLYATTFRGNGSGLTNLSIPGISTSTTSEFTNLNVTGTTTLATAKVSDLTDNRIVIAGTAGELEDTSKLTFDGTTLAIVGNATFTGNVSVAGTLTSEDKTNIDSIGIVTARTGVRIDSGGLVVSSGVATFTDAIDANGGITATTGTFEDLGGAGRIVFNHTNGTLDDHPSLSYVTGTSTLNSSNLNISSSLVAASAKVSDLTSGRVVYVGTAGELQDVSTFTFNGSTVAAPAFSGDGSALTGITAAGTGAIGGITVKDEGVTVGTAGSISAFDFLGATVSVIANTGAAGVATVTIATEQKQDIQTLNVSGISTFGGDTTFANAITVSGNINANQNIIGDGATNIHSINNVSASTFNGTLNTAAQPNITSLGTLTSLTSSGTIQAADFNSTSDIKLKTNIQAIEDPLAKVVQIEGVSFNWKEDNRPALGVIADQVEKIIPELVTDGDPKTVNYNGLIGLLIEAVKEQQVQITELKSKLDSLS